MDTLTVTGLGKRIDGVYDCDLTALLVDVTSPDSLLVSEAETIKRLSGAFGFGIAEQFLAGDWTVRMAVAVVILARHEIRLTERQGWDAKVGAFTFTMEEAPAEEEDDAATTPPEEGETPSESGGESGRPTSDDPPANVLAPTGHLASVAS
jgi:hypothetical protein